MVAPRPPSLQTSRGCHRERHRKQYRETRRENATNRGDYVLIISEQGTVSSEQEKIKKGHFVSIDRSGFPFGAEKVQTGSLRLARTS